MDNPSFKSTITIEEWLNLIRKSDYSNQITEVRKNPSKEAFDELKLTLPCVTYNFLYDKYKLDNNLICSTGLLFIDADSPEFRIENLDKEKVLAYYKSVQGGNRYHIIVRVDGLTYANFHSTYESICIELNLFGIFDTKAKKHSQFSVLSFDKDVYYNYNPYVFTAIPGLCIPIVSNIQKKNTYTYDGDTAIRFNNLDEIEIPDTDDYTVNWDGYEYITAWIPIKKLKDGRKRFLLSYTTNLVWLNPHLHYKKLLTILHNVNQVACEKPLPEQRIQNTLKSVMKHLKEGKLTPIYFRKKRKIVFRKKASLNKAEKLDIVLQELAMKKTNDSILKIQTLIGNWDKEWGQITARKLLDSKNRNELGIRITSKTINKYYKHFKREIDEINQGIKGKRNTTNKKYMSKPDNTINSLYVFLSAAPDYVTYDYLTVIKPNIQESNLSEKSEMPSTDISAKINKLKGEMNLILANCDEITFEIQIDLAGKAKQIARLDSSIRPDLLFSETLRNHPHKKVA